MIRLVVLQVGFAVVFTILAFSFWYFQVVQHEKFKELADKAKAGCPVSKLFNTKITLDASLVG